MSYDKLWAILIADKNCMATIPATHHKQQLRRLNPD